MSGPTSTSATRRSCARCRRPPHSRRSGQKSGVVYGLAPDDKGKILWQFRAGKGGALGGIEWGSAADEQNIYVPVSDVLEPSDEGRRTATPSSIATGEQVWHTPAPPLTVQTRPRLHRRAVGRRSA